MIQAARLLWFKAYALRIQLLIGAGVSAVFLFVGQVFKYFVDFASFNRVPVFDQSDVIFIAIAILFFVTQWLMSLVAILFDRRLSERISAHQSPLRLPWIAPSVVSALPFLALGLFFLNAARHFVDRGYDPTNPFVFASMLLTASAAAIALSAPLGHRLLAAANYPGPPVVRRSLFILLSVVGVLVLATVAVATQADVIGVPSIILLFSCVVSICVSALLVLQNKYEVPLLGPASTLALIIYLGTTSKDSYVADTSSAEISRGRLELDYDRPPPPATAGQAFKAWVANRPDLANYRGGQRPYPVFIVTAQGGGIYAAYHTAIFLARVQAKCPKFASHVFAISSVSGGSLGAALFSSLIRHDPNGFDDRCVLESPANGFVPLHSVEGQAERFLTRDFLTPVVRTGLFYDSLGSVVPIPHYFSRSRTLEREFAGSWDAVVGKPGRLEIEGANPFRSSFRDLWDPRSLAPAIIANAVDAKSGTPIVFAPFLIASNEKLAGDRKLGIINYFGLAPADRLELAEVVGFSAAFPYVSTEREIVFPRPRLEKDESPDHIDALLPVDGGYFDGSGAVTARLLLQEMQSVLSTTATPVELHIVSLYTPPTESESAFMGPAVFSYLHRAQEQCRSTGFESLQSLVPSSRLHVANLYPKRLGLQLSWRLDDRDRIFLHAASGDAVRCGKSSPSDPFAGSDCAAATIINALSNEQTHNQ